METSSNKSKAMLVHLSTFGQWVFPLGNFVFPLVLWSATKKDSKFVDNHGRQAINFQLSVMAYTLVLCLIAIPILVFTVFKHVSFRSMMRDEVVIGENLTPENISGIVILAALAVVLFCFLKIAEFFLVIYAAVKAAEGQEYQYPLCIPFLSIDNQSEEEELAEVTAQNQTTDAIIEEGVQSSSQIDQSEPTES